MEGVHAGLGAVTTFLTNREVQLTHENEVLTVYCGVWEYAGSGEPVGGSPFLSIFQTVGYNDVEDGEDVVYSFLTTD